MALPEAEAFVRMARQRDRVTAFVVSIQLARGEALRRGHPVTLCPSDDGEECGEDLSAGWIVFDDRKGDRDRGPGDELIDRYEAPRAGPVRATIKRLHLAHRGPAGDQRHRHLLRRRGRHPVPGGGGGPHRSPPGRGPPARGQEAALLTRPG